MLQSQPPCFSSKEITQLSLLISLWKRRECQKNLHTGQHYSAGIACTHSFCSRPDRPRGHWEKGKLQWALKLCWCFECKVNQSFKFSTLRLKPQRDAQLLFRLYAAKRCCFLLVFLTRCSSAFLQLGGDSHLGQGFWSHTKRLNIREREKRAGWWTVGEDSEASMASMANMSMSWTSGRISLGMQAAPLGRSWSVLLCFTWDDF